MSKHTPGPWRAEYTNDTGPEDDYFIQWWDIVNDDGDTIAEVDLKADSRLIAAAPELLDLLYHALPCVEESEEFDKPQRPKLSLKIRAIIKQIEGE